MIRARKQGAGHHLGYQLIRGVLAAYSTGGSFCVLCDARRRDMIEKWHSVMRAVRSYAFRCRLKALTWQEIADFLPRPLRRFLAMKYGITSQDYFCASDLETDG